MKTDMKRSGYLERRGTAGVMAKQCKAWKCMIRGGSGMQDVYTMDGALSDDENE